MPVAGETVRWGELVMEVLSVSDRRILKVKVTYAPSEQNAPKQIQRDEETQPEQNQRKPADAIKGVNGAAHQTA